jgi:hypothetical protein
MRINLQAKLFISQYFAGHTSRPDWTLGSNVMDRQFSDLIYSWALAPLWHSNHCESVLPNRYFFVNVVTFRIWIV